MCVCVLCIQTPSVWWPDTVWESVCRRRIHTPHKGPIMSHLSEKEKGVDEGIIGACPSRKGVWWFPCLSPRCFFPLRPTANNYVSTRTEHGGEKQAWYFSILCCESTAVKEALFELKYKPIKYNIMLICKTNKTQIYYLIQIVFYLSFTYSKSAAFTSYIYSHRLFPVLSEVSLISQVLDFWCLYSFTFSLSLK